MVEITFLRTAKYSYQLPNRSLYESFDLVAQRLYEPRLEERPKLPNLLKPDVIFCSPRIRSIETAQLVKQEFNLENELQITESLQEIYFSMSQFITEDEFILKGVNHARAKFIRAFAENRLYETKEETKHKIDRLLNLIDDEYDAVMCCSHGFLMKIIQIYLKDNKIFEKPKELVEQFEPHRITFGFSDYFIQ